MCAYEKSGRVIVLGSDGMDPKILEPLLKAGRMPNFQKVLERGFYSRMRTTNPAESPVAWSSFTTGMNPGKHGIFDFLHRDPATYCPKIAAISVTPRPNRKPLVVSNRKGQSLWRILSDAGVPCAVIRVPVTFPPEKIHGRMLSGMGVPDLRGTWGTSVLYGTNQDECDTEFGGENIPMNFDDGIAHLTIKGPPKAEPLDATLRIDGGKGILTYGNQRIELTVGEYTDWVPVVFHVKAKLGPIGLNIPVKGITKFLLHSVEPEVSLYLSQINFDPASPFLPISHPVGFSKQIQRAHGNFSTLGWSEDTWGLNEGRLDEDDFLTQVMGYHDKLEDITLDIIASKREEFVISVFEGTDRCQHMFWRHIDETHPMFKAEEAQRYADVIERSFIRFDETVGKVLAELNENDTVILMSDHGFNTFKRAVNINTWLKNEGYLIVEGADIGEPKGLKDLYAGKNIFPNVDWKKSKAYSLGLGKIYINLKGRESCGSVEPGRDYQQVRQEIIDKFSKLVDPKTNKEVVSRLSLKERIFSGSEIGHAGDIVVSFKPGYRVSWQTALGGFPEHVIEDNYKKWSADHCTVEPDETSGILIANTQFNLPENDPSIMDLAPTILHMFGVPIPKEMDGKSLLG